MPDPGQNCHGTGPVISYVQILILQAGHQPVFLQQQKLLMLLHCLKVFKKEAPGFGNHFRASMDLSKLMDSQAVCGIYLVLQVSAAYSTDGVELELAGRADESLHIVFVDGEFPCISKVQQCWQYIRIYIMKLDTSSNALHEISWEHGTEVMAAECKDSPVTGEILSTSAQGDIHKFGLRTEGAQALQDALRMGREAEV